MLETRDWVKLLELFAYDMPYTERSRNTTASGNSKRIE